jgi:hypothetical protein
VLKLETVQKGLIASKLPAEHAAVRVAVKSTGDATNARMRGASRFDLFGD